jgi:hypothetical protein
VNKITGMDMFPHVQTTGLHAQEWTDTQYNVTPRRARMFASLFVHLL